MPRQCFLDIISPLIRGIDGLLLAQILILLTLDKPVRRLTNRKIA
jgi:hypothetical protein